MKCLNFNRRLFVPRVTLKWLKNCHINKSAHYIRVYWIKSVLTAFLLVPTNEQRASRLPISNQQRLFSDRKPRRTTHTKINRRCLLLCVNSRVKASILPQSFLCWLFLKVQSANKEFSRTLAQGRPKE